MRTLPILALLASALSSPAANVVWLEWTGPGGAGGLTGGFPTGGPAGTVSATRSGAIDGGASAGVPGAVAQNITTLSSTFNGFYGAGNPGTRLPFIGNTYNDSGDRYVVNIDFTTLTDGVLQAGAIFAFVDYDIAESLQDLTAFTLGGSMVTSAWLASVGGAGAYIDAAPGPDQSGSMPVAAPTLTQAGGIYQVGGAAGNMDSGFYVFRTTVPLTSLRYEHFRNVSGQAVAGGGGGGIAIGAEVPEPGAWGLAAAGLGLLSLRFRRWGA